MSAITFFLFFLFDTTIVCINIFTKLSGILFPFKNVSLSVPYGLRRNSSRRAISHLLLTSSEVTNYFKGHSSGFTSRCGWIPLKLSKTYMYLVFVVIIVVKFCFGLKCKFEGFLGLPEHDFAVYSP